MYTEYNSQNISNNQTVHYNQSNNEQNNNYQEPGGNKFFSVLWKILLIIIIFVITFLLLIQFNVITLNSTITPDAVVLNQNEVGIKKGTGYQIITTVLPQNASNKQVIYESSDPSVATVNEVTGYVKGIKNGTAIITVKTLINEKVTECVVNVGNTNVLVDSININDKDISLAVGYSETLSYKVSPSNATELNLNFSSSDPTIATVDSRGVVTGVKAGNAIITVSTNNNTVTDTAYVTVYKKGESTVVSGEPVTTDNYPKNISIPSSKSLSVGASVQLEPTITPSNAISILNWSSSDPSVARVDSQGIVTAVNIGTANIIVSTINGQTSSCQVTVGNYSIRLESIAITTRYSYLQKGLTRKLFVSYKPINASNPTIRWYSSNDKVATVENGIVTAINVGSAIITAESVEGGFKDSIEIEVGGGGTVTPVKEISIGNTTRDVYIGGTIQITPTITPTNATYKTVTYTSNNPSVATVNENGLVTGIKEGTAVITVRSNRDNVTSNLTVNVKNNPSIGVELNTTSVSINQNDTFTLAATVKPSNASNKTVTYISSNSNIATVDQTGIIRGISKGTVTITVTPNGGGSPSTCLVTVN